MGGASTRPQRAILPSAVATTPSLCCLSLYLPTRHHRMLVHCPLQVGHDTRHLFGRAQRRHLAILDGTAERDGQPVVCGGEGRAATHRCKGRTRIQPCQVAPRVADDAAAQYLGGRELLDKGRRVDRLAARRRGELGLYGVIGRRQRACRVRVLLKGREHRGHCRFSCARGEVALQQRIERRRRVCAAADAAAHACMRKLHD
mmetsp:Transcript_27250/g.54863  ORF Transcript_27250/g.54863 Transcript_27250/m.54863 type:complete len:202 (-) Transcript_27250:5817-6422(-)